MCVGNHGRKDVKVQFVAKEGNDKFTVRSNPTVVTLLMGTADVIGVFVTPLSSTTNDDAVVVAGPTSGAG